LYLEYLATLLRADDPSNRIRHSLLRISRDSNLFLGPDTHSARGIRNGWERCQKKKG